MKHNFIESTIRSLKGEGEPIYFGGKLDPSFVEGEGAEINFITYPLFYLSREG